MENSKFSLKEFDELRHLIKETVVESLEVNIEPAIKKHVNGKIDRLTTDVGGIRQELASVKVIVENDYAWKNELLWFKHLSSWVRKTSSGAWTLTKVIIPIGTAMGLLYAFYQFIIK